MNEQQQAAALLFTLTAKMPGARQTQEISRIMGGTNGAGFCKQL